MSIAWYIPFQITTSYSTFYAFFSSFRIKLWPMWLANSKRQPCFYPPQSHAQEDTQNWHKTWQTWWENCAVPENIQFSFSCSFFFYTVKLHGLTQSVWGPLLVYYMFRAVFRPSSGVSLQKSHTGRYVKYLRDPLFTVTIFYRVKTIENMENIGHK